MFHQEPSFPHNHFSMVSDTQRLQAYAAALRTALARAAAQKQEQQLCGTAAAPAAGAVPGSVSSAQDQLAGSGTASPQRLDLTVFDVGCGSGVLSLLAAAALSSPPNHSPLTAAPTAKAVTHSLPVDSADAIGQTATASAAAPDTAPVQHNVSVVGVELTKPLAAVAQRVVAANGAAGAVSIIQADAGSCMRGQQVLPGGADVIVLDLFDAGWSTCGAGFTVAAAVAGFSSLAARRAASIWPDQQTMLWGSDSWCHVVSLSNCCRPPLLLLPLLAAAVLQVLLATACWGLWSWLKPAWQLRELRSCPQVPHSTAWAWSC